MRTCRDIDSISTELSFLSVLICLQKALPWGVIDPLAPKSVRAICSHMRAPRIQAPVYHGTKYASGIVPPREYSVLLDRWRSIMMASLRPPSKQRRPPRANLTTHLVSSYLDPVDFAFHRDPPLTTSERTSALQHLYTSSRLAYTSRDTPPSPPKLKQSLAQYPAPSSCSGTSSGPLRATVR
jgi:hypothetical protein